MKSTAYLALPLSLPVILFTVFRGNRQRWAWRVLVIGALVAVMATITWGDAATWYRATSQSIPARVRHPQAPFGNHAFQVDTTADVTPPWLAPLTQPLPTEQVQSLRGQTLTLGVWMWASAPLQARTPTIDVGGQLYFREIPVDTEPRFYALTATLTDEATRAWVSLAPALVAQETNAHVYYDGLVLAVGKRPSDEPPVFEDMAARKGSWGGLPFENLLRNPSAEEAGPRVRLGLDDLGAKILPDQTRPSMILTSLLDPAGAGWYYTLTAQNILRTFWAKFG
ncbi:MAG: hypothetical protein GTO53_03840, partial [Planctomycetales bacterium]|nr:hypothetical protein [Planctomycetales bacterium]